MRGGLVLCCWRLCRSSIEKTQRCSSPHVGAVKQSYFISLCSLRVAFRFVCRKPLANWRRRVFSFFSSRRHHRLVVNSECLPRWSVRHSVHLPCILPPYIYPPARLSVRPSVRLLVSESSKSSSNPSCRSTGEPVVCPLKTETAIVGRTS